MAKKRKSSGYLRLCTRCIRANRVMAAAAVCFLILQTVCELTLPVCTASLLNIGVGQRGIVSVLLPQFSRTGMERLLLLMTEQESAAVLSVYREEADGYVKGPTDREQEEELLEIMTAPMVAVYALTTDGADYEAILGEELYVPRGMDTFGILSLLPYDARMELTEAARERIREIPQALVTQAAVNFAAADLQEQGQDTDALQNEYLAGQLLRMLLASAGLAVCTLLAVFCTSRLASEGIRRLRQEAFSTVMGMDRQTFEAFSAPSLLLCLTEDMDRMQRGLSFLFRAGLQALFLGGGAVFLAFRAGRLTGWLLSGLILLLLLLTAGILLAASSPLRRLAAEKTEQVRLILENLRGIVTIRVSGMERQRNAQLRENSQAIFRLTLKAERITAFGVPALLLLANAASVLAAYMGLSGIESGTMQTGDLVAILQYLLLVIQAFQGLALSFSGAGESGRRVTELLVAGDRRRSAAETSVAQKAGTGEPVGKNSAAGVAGGKERRKKGSGETKSANRNSASEMPGAKETRTKGFGETKPVNGKSAVREPGGKERHTKAPGTEQLSARRPCAVRFQNVTFSYPGSGQPALREISFEAEYGTVTAIVGQTGAGKSTLLSLIPALYEGQEGAVYIDGKETGAYDPEALREKIGFVPQESRLFAGSVAENLRCGRPYSEEKLDKALEIAQAQGFLQASGEGAEAVLAPGGLNLSGGQRQRLCIARALVRRPQILLLDDCCSALDYETGRRLLAALKKESGQCAVLMATQRIREALLADRILVLQEGRLAGAGTHAELLAGCEPYRSLWSGRDL